MTFCAVKRLSPGTLFRGAEHHQMCEEAPSVNGLKGKQHDFNDAFYRAAKSVKNNTKASKKRHSRASFNYEGLIKLSK